MREGNRRFIELAVAIWDTASLRRIQRCLHPFRDEFIDPKDWPLPDGVAV